MKCPSILLAALVAMTAHTSVTKALNLTGLDPNALYCAKLHGRFHLETAAPYSMCHKEKKFGKEVRGTTRYRRWKRFMFDPCLKYRGSWEHMKSWEDWNAAICEEYDRYVEAEGDST